MAIEQKLWSDTDDETWKAWGNTPTTLSTDDGEIWSGLCAGWQETPAGGIEIRRRVELDPEHTMAFTFAMLGPGGAFWIETESYSFDLPAIIARDEAEREAIEQQRASIEAERRGLAVPGGPSRAQRRAGA